MPPLNATNDRSEPEPRAEACDPRRDDPGDESERRTRLEIRRGRCGRVQHVEDVDVDLEAASAADREILAAAKVQDVLRRELLAAVRFQTDGGVAVLRDLRPAVGVDLTEDVGA